VKPLEALTAGEARAVDGIFTDIDDTLTAGGRLEPEAYRALCDARAAGLRIACVTGRPGGWAEVLAALWPVDAVVAENGALYVRASGQHVYWDGEAARAEERARLEALRADVIARLPFARVVDDQPLRRVDVAFDVGEHARLAPAEIERLVEAIHAHGARSLVSTVHAHAFYGGFDKAKMLLRMAREEWGVDEATGRARYLFVGDSPNDQAGFACFALTVGVANVARYADRMAPPPRFVTAAPRGRGFAELVERLLALRGSSPA
jgi:HAD superfamily hydrolase (TIGR01484 family)